MTGETREATPVRTAFIPVEKALISPIHPVSGDTGTEGVPAVFTGSGKCLFYSRIPQHCMMDVLRCAYQWRSRMAYVVETVHEMDYLL